MRVDRLKLIAKGLLTLKQFDFSDVISDATTPTGRIKKPTLHCGAVGCAVGSIPIIDPGSGVSWSVYWANRTTVEMTEDGVRFEGYQEVASHYFQIPFHDASSLFASNQQGFIQGWGDYPVCGANATAQEVHDAMMHYIEIRS